MSIIRSFGKDANVAPAPPSDATRTDSPAGAFVGAPDLTSPRVQANYHAVVAVPTALAIVAEATGGIGQQVRDFVTTVGGNVPTFLQTVLTTVSETAGRIVPVVKPPGPLS